MWLSRITFITFNIQVEWFLLIHIDTIERYYNMYTAYHIQSNSERGISGPRRVFKILSLSSLENDSFESRV